MISNRWIMDCVPMSNRRAPLTLPWSSSCICPLDLQPDTAIWLREAAVQNLERQQVLEIARHSIESLPQRTRALVTWPSANTS